MNAYQIACKACGKLIPAADVNIDKAIAKCLACDAVFSIAGDVGVANEPRLPVPMPKGFRVESWGSELTLTRRWYTHSLWGLLLFCIFWDGFLVVWYTIGIAGLFSDNFEGPVWVMLVFPVLHVAVGVAMTYAVLCGFFNRTVVRISGGELTVRHGPIPWPSQLQLFASDVRQLYVAESKRPAGQDSCRRTYDVVALLAANDKVTLLTGLEDVDHGVFVEQQIEQHLKIPDERVPGEVRV